MSLVPSWFHDVVQRGHFVRCTDSRVSLVLEGLSSGSRKPYVITLTLSVAFRSMPRWSKYPITNLPSITQSLLSLSLSLSLSHAPCFQPQPSSAVRDRTWSLMLGDRAPQVVAPFAGRLSRPRVQPPPLPSSPHNNNLSGIAGSMRRARQPRAKSRNRNFPDGALHDRAGLVALPGQSAGEIIHAAACYGAGKSATTRRGLPGELRPPPGNEAYGSSIGN